MSKKLRRPRRFELKKRAPEVACAFCNRPSSEAHHVCDHGSACGSSCPRCLEVDLLLADSDGRIFARKRGMFEVSLEVNVVVTHRIFRRIMAAIRDDWNEDLQGEGS
jgi:hypothetical protein